MTTDKKQKQTAKPAAGSALTGAAVPDKSAAASAAPAGKAPVYESGYSAQVQDSLDKILNREKFDYNVNEDKLFSQYKDSYEKAGRQAMQDAMGNAALLTGGYGSSYAATAGQQAYNSYMDKLADKIPELEAKACGIRIKNVKFEKGNKPTDWTPAPEDNERRIASLEARVAALEAAAVSGGEV